MKTYFHTFGCRVNQYETQALRERCAGTGSSAVDDWEEADVCVVNTCTVTAEADGEALRLLRRIAKRNPVARLIVTGCLATRDAGLIRRSAPHAEIIENAAKDDLPAALGCAAMPAFRGVSALHRRARAFVKVQDGCNMGCTFCVIPSIRPLLSSKPWPQLQAEVAGLVDGGLSEIVLCGIRLGRYLSEDSSGRRVDLCGALERLLEMPGRFRLRLSSLEITDATNRLFELMSRSKGKLCPSLHAPLQSGSTAVLRRMKRWYSADFYRRRAEVFLSSVPQAALFADIMIGFPDETPSEYEESLTFAERLGFSGLHVFRYSRRPDTEAARRPAVAQTIVAQRARQWRRLDGKLREGFARRAVGARRTVVPELDGVSGLCEDFLRVSLDGPAAAGLLAVRVVRAQSELAFAVPLRPGQLGPTLRGPCGPCERGGRTL